MFKCPLCTTLQQNKIVQFPEIMSLKNHIDLVHCVISRNEENIVTKNLISSENRALSCIEDGILTCQKKMKLIKNAVLSPDFDVFRKKQENIDNQNLERLKFENDFFRKTISKQETEYDDQKTLLQKKMNQLRNTVKKLADFLTNASFEQKIGKIELANFLQEILDDLERKEAEIDNVRCKLVNFQLL